MKILKNCEEKLQVRTYFEIPEHFSETRTIFENWVQIFKHANIFWNLEKDIWIFQTKETGKRKTRK